MKIMDRVLGRQPQANLENPTYPLTSMALLDALGMKSWSTSGANVNPKSALGVAAIWRAVNLIAAGGASLPLHPYRKVEKQGRIVSEQVLIGPAADLLDNPHPDLTPFELWELAYGHVALWGNAYLQILRDPTGQIRELWPIHPSKITPGRASDGTKIYQFTGYDEPLGDRQILHIPGFGYDGVCGMSAIRVHRNGIGLAMSAEEFGGKLFSSGSMAAGILHTDQRLTQDQADTLKSRWKAKVGGLSKAYEIAVLDAGAKFQQLTIPPEDAQFLQTRGFQVEEVARIFGVPPHLLMSTEKSTSWGSGIEQMSLGFVTMTLRPSWLTRFEQRITKLFTPAPDRIFAKYSIEGLLRGDSTARAAFYKNMWEIGAFSTNDIRELEDRSPVEGGDVRYRPLNFGVLGDTEPYTSVTPDAIPTTTETDTANVA